MVPWQELGTASASAPGTGFPSSAGAKCCRAVCEQAASSLLPPSPTLPPPELDTTARAMPPTTPGQLNEGATRDRNTGQKLQCNPIWALLLSQVVLLEPQCPCFARGMSQGERAPACASTLAPRGKGPTGKRSGDIGSSGQGDNSTDSRPVAAGSKESPSPASTGGVFPMGEVGRSSMQEPWPHTPWGVPVCHWLSPQSPLHSPQGYPLVPGSPLELCLS